MISEPPPSPFPHDLETAVLERYGAAAREREAACSDNSALLAALPPKVIERDYVPGRARTIFELGTLEELSGAPIATGAHCFGCTAGTGSSCGGSLA